MCNCKCDYEKCFEFDFIEGIEGVNIPKFTQKNLALITVFLKYNSSYSAAENQEEGSYSRLLAENKDIFFDFDDEGDSRYGFDENGKAKTLLYRVMESIDSVNSTHLASEGGGRRKPDELPRNKGRVMTAEAIKGIEGLKELMYNGDCAVVNTIASAVKGKYNFSFATKFCTYVSKYIFGESHNKYCIYDKVVQSVLPVYIAYYVDQDKLKDYMKGYYHGKTRGKNKGDMVSKIDDCIISERNREEKDYEKYREIIDLIIDGVREKDKIDVSYEQFDHLLWYYFKGSERRVQQAMNVIEQLIALD